MNRLEELYKSKVKLLEKYQAARDNEERTWEKTVNETAEEGYSIEHWRENVKVATRATSAKDALWKKLTEIYFEIAEEEAKINADPLDEFFISTNNTNYDEPEDLYRLNIP